MAYGYSVKEGKDEMVNLVDLAMENFSTATSPGAFVVDVLPILRHIPSWFPGSGFKRIAAAWKKTFENLLDEPFNFVKKQMVSPFRHPLHQIQALIMANVVRRIQHPEFHVLALGKR